MLRRKKSLLLPEGYVGLQAEVGATLRKAREEVRLTQAELGKAAGVSRETVSRIEAGRQPRLQVLNALMEALNLEERDVFVLGDNSRPLPHVPGSRGEQVSRIGEAIKEARAAHKLSLLEAAKVTGISAAQLSRLERGLVTWSKSFAEDPDEKALPLEDRLVEITNVALRKLLDLD